MNLLFILNSVGLQNPGVDAFIAEELPFLRQYDVKVIANISGNTPEEYGVMCEKLDGAGVDLIEVNISCPNVKHGGMAFGTSPENAAAVGALGFFSDRDALAGFLNVEKL